MRSFSKEIKNFLSGAGSNQNISIVSKGSSCGQEGDIVFFRYSLGSGVGSRAYRIFILTRPITKDAKTGNTLLTGFKVHNLNFIDSSKFTSLNLANLYKSAVSDYKLSQIVKEKGIRRQQKNKSKKLNVVKKIQMVKDLLAKNDIGSEYRTYIIKKIYGPMRKITFNTGDEE
jgi:hypothetical protein